MIGAGNMATTHAEAWRSAGESVTHVLDRGSTNAASLASRLGAEAQSDLEAICDAVDVVDICSPTPSHLDYVLAAASAETAVVCEKPLGRTASDAHQAVEACHSAGVPLLVAHVLRFFPEYVSARDRVVSGDIGRVAVVRLDRSTYSPATEGSWFNDPAQSGGVVLDLMIHDVDYARWVAGDVERVYARLAGTEGVGGHVLATLRHVDGALTHIQGSWAFPKGTFQTSLELAGSDGLITLHSAQPFQEMMDTNAAPSAVPQPPSVLAESPYVTMIKHFSETLRGRAAAVVAGTDAVAAVAICEAVAESIASGLPVTLAGTS